MKYLLAICVVIAAAIGAETSQPEVANTNEPVKLVSGTTNPPVAIPQRTPVYILPEVVVVRTPTATFHVIPEHNLKDLVKLFPGQAFIVTNLTIYRD